MELNLIPYDTYLLETLRPEEPPDKPRGMDINTHICTGCEYARYHGDFYSCCFVGGSCAKVPGSIEHPAGDASTSSELKAALAEREALTARYKEIMGRMRNFGASFDTMERVWKHLTSAYPDIDADDWEVLL